MLNSNNDFIRILSRSAVSGIGISTGRDLYKGMKKNWFLIIAVLVLLVAPFMLARMATQGHDAREAGLKAKLPAVSLTGIFFILIFMWLGSGASSGLSTNHGQGDSIVPALLVISAIAAGLGAMIGMFERSKRLRGFQIAADNERFLQDNGIRNLGGESQALRDGAGTEMVIDERRDNEIVLKVVGRRMKRAFLTHDDEGRFIQYIPAEGL